MVQKVYSCSVSCDDKFIASASDDGTLKLWNRKSGNCIHTFQHPVYYHCEYVTWIIVLNYYCDSIHFLIFLFFVGLLLFIFSQFWIYCCWRRRKNVWWFYCKSMECENSSMWSNFKGTYIFCKYLFDLQLVILIISRWMLVIFLQIHCSFFQHLMIPH